MDRSWFGGEKSGANEDGMYIFAHIQSFTDQLQIVFILFTIDPLVSLF